MFVLDVKVDGRPRSKGSHLAQRTASGRVRVAAQQEEDLRRWERLIRSAASLERSAAQRDGSWPRETWAGAVVALADFRLMAPRRLADELEPGPALVVPDLDKITRALLDGLNGVAYADDKQVIVLHVTKSYASPLERAGVTARVVAVEDGDTAAGWTVGRIVEGWTGR